MMILNGKSKYYLSIIIVSILIYVTCKIIQSHNLILQKSTLLAYLLDSLPSFLHTLGFCMLALIFIKKNQIVTMGFITLGSIIYELEQSIGFLNITIRTFDLIDIFAIILGYLFSILIFKIIK